MRNKDPKLINYTTYIGFFGKSAKSNSKGKFSIRIFKSLKYIFELCTTIVIATIAPITIMAQESVDTLGVKEFVASYQNVWNTKSPIDVAKFFSEDADMVFGNGTSAKGREAIENGWRNYFNRQELDRRGWFDLASIKFLTPTTAVVNIQSTTGIEDDTTTFRKARGTWLVQQKKGYWKIEAMRGLPTVKDQVELVASVQTTEILRPQIRAFVAAYEEAFNQHDPDKLTEFYRIDADIIIREQPIISGTKAINKWWQTYFSQPRPYRAILIIDEIRMISKDVALLNITATGASLEPTEHLIPTRNARGTWILLQEDGRWLISNLRLLPSTDDKLIRH